MTALFELNDISLSYGKNRVINSFSLTVAPGEIVAIVGQSGSGKTTLLSTLHGFLKPDYGTVVFQGKNLYELPEKELAHYRNTSVGMVYQFFNLVPDITAISNVMLPMIIAGILKEDAERHAEELLEKVGLKEYAGKKTESLSGGQQQRVALARALANNPAVILADEPTGSLDAANTMGICKLLADSCRNNGTALIVVTHDDKVAAFADRIVEL